LRGLDWGREVRNLKHRKVARQIRRGFIYDDHFFVLGLRGEAGKELKKHGKKKGRPLYWGKKTESSRSGLLSP